MGERGSRRNRFFLWLRNLKQQKKKKQEEEKIRKKRKEETRKKEQQIKTYSKPKVICLTAIGLFLGLVETILLPKKKEEKQLLQIDKKLQALQEETNFLKIEVKKENAKKIETKKQTIAQKETLVKIQEKQNQQQKTLEEVKKELNEIEKKNKKKEKTDNQKKITESKEKITAIATTQKQTKKILEQQEQIVNQKIQEPTLEQKKKGGIDLEEEQLRMLNHSFEQELNQIKQAMTSTNFDQTIEKLEQLQSKMTPYQKNEKISKTFAACVTLKNECYAKQNQIKEKIYHKKEVILTKNELLKQELVLKIRRQQQLMEKMNEQVLSLPSKKKKRGIFKTFGKIITSTLLTGFGISRFFKKKVSMFDIFLGAVFTNYGIRGMRNLGKDKENQVAYFNAEKIVEQLSSEQKALEVSVGFYADSIEQLQSLKKEFLLEYGSYNFPEVKKIQEQFETLEEDLKKKLDFLYQRQESMNRVMEQGKEKVKKLEV